MMERRVCSGGDTDPEIDRRARRSRSSIKNALLELLAEKGFGEVTVAEVCRRADVARPTFYAHYPHLMAVVDELLEDSVSITHRDTDDYAAALEKMLSAVSAEGVEVLERDPTLLPACQRVIRSPKYHALFVDADLARYTLDSFMRATREAYVASFVGRFGLSRKSAEALYVFILNGSFAAGRTFDSEDVRTWNQRQCEIARFVLAGLEAVGAEA